MPVLWGKVLDWLIAKVTLAINPKQSIVCTVVRHSKVLIVRSNRQEARRIASRVNLIDLMKLDVLSIFRNAKRLDALTVFVDGEQVFLAIAQKNPRRSSTRCKGFLDP
jgi:hypothetical protein